MIRRIKMHIQWMLRARFFGIRFFRRAWFRPPKHITASRCEMELAYDSNEERNVCLVLFENFVDDQYGLSVLKGPITTIADIGANIGCFTLAAKGYFPASTIHAYEPNPRILPVLQRNVTKTGACVFPEAVGAAGGYVKMIDDTFSGSAGTESVAASPQAIPQVSLEKVNLTVERRNRPAED